MLVIEKETLPRYKPCGGGLSTRILKETFPFSFEPVVETQVKAVAYTFGGRAHVIPVPGGEVQTVMRDQFDAHLLAHARAEVRPGVYVRNVIELEDRVVVETSGGNTVEGCYLIGADGAKSVVACYLGLHRGRSMSAAICRNISLRPIACSSPADCSSITASRAAHQFCNLPTVSLLYVVSHRSVPERHRAGRNSLIAPFSAPAHLCGATSSRTVNSRP